MTTYRFERMATQRLRTHKCPDCSKWIRRSRTFGQTVNPFNRNPDGTTRTRREVWLAVNAEADAWQPDFTHDCAAVPGESN